MAIGALLVLAVIIALGVHSCDRSATQNALQSYTNNVSSLIAQSDQTSDRLFGILSGAAATGSPTTVQNRIDQTLSSANQQLQQARNFSVPGQVTAGHRDLVLVLRMRADGIAKIASEIQPALGPSEAPSAVSQIAQQTARFYGSDIVYKDYAAPEIAGAVNAAGVRFGGLNRGQFLPDVRWVLPSFIATQLHVSLKTGKPVSGIHGHVLNSVSVGGASLQTTATNSIPASPAPTFTMSFTNAGHSTETNVVCKVTVSGTSVSGTTTVPQTIAGQTSTCQVTLDATPPAGSQTVVATVEPVPGERDTQNNTLTFPVTFQ